MRRELRTLLRDRSSAELQEQFLQERLAHPSSGDGLECSCTLTVSLARSLNLWLQFLIPLALCPALLSGLGIRDHRRGGSPQGAPVLLRMQIVRVMRQTSWRRREVLGRKR